MSQSEELYDRHRRNVRRTFVGIVFLFLILLVYLFFSGKSFFRSAEESETDHLGDVEIIRGKLRRQPFDSIEFLSVRKKDSVYSDDALITGNDDQATIRLQDGTQVDLSPGALIKLSFQNSERTETGQPIRRRILVDVLTGSVTARVATADMIVIMKAGKEVILPVGTAVVQSPPVEDYSPAPISEPKVSEVTTPPALSPDLSANAKVKFIFPVEGQQIKPEKSARAVAKLKWQTDSEKPLMVQIAVENIEHHALVFNQSFSTTETDIVFAHPGKYRISIAAPGAPEKPWDVRKMEVEKNFIGIKTLPPLVNGEDILSNDYRGKISKKFDVALRWVPFADVKNYKVSVYNSGKKLLLEQTVNKAAYQFNPDHVFTEPVFFEISGALPSGFVVHSERERFLFNFLSPQQTFPPTGASFSAAQTNASKNGGILFTWQKTSFTDRYVFELSVDEDFKTTFKTVPTKNNLLIFKNLKPGTYFWRVFAYSGDLKSPPRAPLSITITP